MRELAILGRGKTWVNCPDNIEVWAVSCPRNWKIVDRLFVMDDIRTLNGLTHDNCYQIIPKINENKMPVYLQKVDSGIPTSIKYPIHQVVEFFRRENIFFCNSISYVLALAIMEGYEKIYFHGVDQNTLQEYMAEKGGVEFWVGMAMGMGIEVVIPEGSAVCKNAGRPLFYGYCVDSIDQIV